MKRKILVITLGVALLTVTGGVAAAQFNTDTPKAKTVNSEQVQNEGIAPVQEVAEAPVEAAQAPSKPAVAPKTGQVASSQGEGDDEPAEPTLVSTSRCAVTVVLSTETQGNVTRTNTDNFVYTVQKYSDGHTVVTESAGMIVSGLAECANNEAPQPVGV